MYLPAIVNLDREDTVLLVDARTYEVRRVGFNHCGSHDASERARARASLIRVELEIAPGCLVLSGLVANLLYVALSGHRFATQHPRDASPLRARQARAYIAGHRDDDQFEIAARVVAAFGDVVQPWLGVTKLDGRGGPVEGCAEYMERLSL
jgi:hypothetical protein